MRSGAYLPLLLVIQAVWLLGPGVVAGAELARRGIIATYLVVPIAGVIGGLVGYGALWFYLISVRAGHAYSYVTIVLAAAAVALIVVRPAYRKMLLAVDVAAPLVLLGLLAMFYVAITFSCTVTIGQGTYLGNACHMQGSPGDNVIPQIFGDNILAGVPKATVWDWQTSARPPLQTGVALMQDPMIHGFGGRLLGYETVAVLLQALWVPALWALLRAFKLSGYRLVAVLTMCAFTGFFIFNSLYVWPKLVAAAMTLAALMLVFFEKRSWWTWTLAGLAAGAGMLCHSGVAFTLIPIGMLVLLRRYRPRLRYLALTALGGVVTLLPWELYQKLYDPPGDQLLKYYFAGVWEPDDGKATPQPLGHLIVKGYTDPSFTTILHDKWMNVASYVGYPGIDWHIAGGGGWGQVRAHEWAFLIWGLGLFNLALVMLLVPALRRRLRPAMDVPRLRLMFAVIGLNLILAAAVYYGPGLATPAIFQGSYALMILLFATLGAILTVLPKRAVNVLVVLNVAYGSVVWVALVWKRHLHHHASFMVVSVLSAAAVLVALWFLARRLDAASAREQSDDPADVPGPRRPAEAVRDPAQARSMTTRAVTPADDLLVEVAPQDDGSLDQLPEFGHPGENGSG